MNKQSKGIIGKPKYKEGDEVIIRISIDGEEKPYKGKVFIVDAWGTFEQNKEPSYDILIEDMNLLVKHCVESCVESV